jgi:hypothetical protein
MDTLGFLDERRVTLGSPGARLSPNSAEPDIFDTDRNIHKCFSAIDPSVQIPSTIMAVQTVARAATYHGQYVLKR